MTFTRHEENVSLKLERRVRLLH